MRSFAWSAAASACLLTAACHRPQPGSANIAQENALEGSRAFWPARGHDAHEVEAYALHGSIKQGQPLEIALSTNEPSQVYWQLFRMGHYSGAGGRLVDHGGPVESRPQPACPLLEPERGLVECAWPAGLTLRSGSHWPGGVYLLKLTREGGAEAYVPFVVHDGRPHDIVVAIPTATWVAYNHWGGQSLYSDASGKLGGHSYVVSYDKPFVRDYGAGELFRRDRALIQWLEAQGLDVAYATSEDLDRDGATLLDGAKALVLSGHDEYWTSERRRLADEVVSRGVSLLSLGANQAYWHVRMEAGAGGRDRRRVVCYKGKARALDPVGVGSPELTIRFRDLGRPENALFGVMYQDSWSLHDYPLVVRDASHWALEGTGFKEGDVIASAHGDEVDALIDNGKQPAGVEVLAASPFLNLHGLPRTGNMVVRRQGSALIFAAGGTDFVKTLSGGDSYDPRAGRIVANVLYRALGKPPPAELPHFDHPRPSRPADKFARFVEVFAGQPGHPGDADGPRGVGRLQAPVAVALFADGRLAIADAGTRKLRIASRDGELSTLATPGLGRVLGLAADAAGNLYASDNENHAIVRIAPDGTMVRLAGGNGPGKRDGSGSQAKFDNPQGIALERDQSGLLVADLIANSVRRIDLRDPEHAVTTIASGLAYPAALAVQRDGTVLVAEMGRDRIVALSANGPPRLVAGGHTGFNDGKVESARFQLQFGLALLPDGALVVSDSANYRLRHIMAGQVATLAGTGRGSHRGNTGKDADLVLPAGIAATDDGRVFVAEAGAGAIRLVTP